MWFVVIKNSRKFRQYETEGLKNVHGTNYNGSTLYLAEWKAVKKAVK